MKKYVLKDKVLYDWLCANSDDFEEEFQKACTQGFENNWSFICLSFLINKNSVLMEDEVELAFKKTAIECTEFYDPHAWNEFPEVTPPQGKLMRIEYENAEREKVYCSGVFYDIGWTDATHGHYSGISKCRFRPWED